MRRHATVGIFLALAVCGVAQITTSKIWEAEDSGSQSSLRGIHNAGPGVAWASGANGTVLRSEDDGYLWQQPARPDDSAKLDFRGVWAWGADRAILMSSGSGAVSRLFRTTDGGVHWQLLFTNPDVAGFWDAIAFSNQQQGTLLGDPVNGRFVIYRTGDGGDHWQRDDARELAADSRGESAFAASNSALTLTPDGRDVYFGTGGAGGSRIFHWHAGHWSAIRLNWPHPSDTSGVFSVAFRDSMHGVAVGGDYKEPDSREGTAAFTSNAGESWTSASDPPSGYRSAVAWSQSLHAWIAVGPNGSDISYDDGKTWKSLGRMGWNALSLPWVAGEKGAIAMLKESFVKH